MKICDTKDHGEIVFEGRDCEACETINELEGQVESLKAEIKELKAEAVAAKREAEDEERDAVRERAIEARIEEEIDHASS